MGDSRQTGTAFHEHGSDLSPGPIQIGIVGLGKIARDQHLPALAASGDFTLAAIASRNATADDIPSYSEIGDMLAAHPELDAVSLCTPPQGRHALARVAIDAGMHVMLEKPPGATVSEVRALAEIAAARKVTLFATWHSREASAVEPARAWLEGRRIDRVRVAWKEDVRVWHPGQQWIWQPGGLGVFDPGINALSIVTRLLPGALVLDEAALSFPANKAAPIAAELHFTYETETPVMAVFDFRQTGPQSWDIEIETDGGTLLLSHGGTRMAIDGVTTLAAPDREYPQLYARFAELIRGGQSDVDLAPLQHVADAFLLGRRIEVEPFED